MTTKNLFDIVYNSALINLSENLGVQPVNTQTTAQRPPVTGQPSSNLQTLVQSISTLPETDKKAVMAMLQTTTPPPSSVQSPSTTTPPAPVNKTVYSTPQVSNLR